MFISDQCSGKTNLYFLSAAIEHMEHHGVCLDTLKMYQSR